ncbi:hypothetical protein BACIT_1395 [Bacillus amyloliquefaciens]|nr:hypothetical protein BACIT_1395 [Bacillus amyloliquefaciens]
MSKPSYHIRRKLSENKKIKTVSALFLMNGRCPPGDRVC